MRLKKIIHKSFFCLIFISIFSCSHDKLNSSDIQSPTNNDSAKTTLRNSIPDSDTLTYVKPTSEKNLMLRIEGELMNCEGGSTVELSCCTRYIADSLTIVLDVLCDSLITDLKSSIADLQEQLLTTSDKKTIQYINDEISYHQNLKDDLISAQKYFYKHLNAELKLVGSLINGTGRVLFQNEAEVKLLEERIADLKELFWVE